MIQISELENLLMGAKQLSDWAKVKIVDRGVPHAPHKLNKSKMSIMIFEYKERVFLVGIAGPNSNPRFQHQHYLPNGNGSTLAKFLLEDASMAFAKLNEHNVGGWMKQNMRRIDILVDTGISRSLLDEWKKVLVHTYHPKYERQYRQIKIKGKNNAHNY